MRQCLGQQRLQRGPARLIETPTIAGLRLGLRNQGRDTDDSLERPAFHLELERADQIESKFAPAEFVILDANDRYVLPGTMERHERLALPQEYFDRRGFQEFGNRRGRRLRMEFGDDLPRIPDE